MGSHGQPHKGKAGSCRMGIIQSAGVRYNGGAVNRTMFAGIQLFGGKYNSESVELLRNIERKAGK